LFALNDANRDFKFDQASEAIAFCDSLIVPSFEPAVRNDTIWKDSLTVDTIQKIHYTRFTPDDVLLRLFQEPFERQYLTKSERPNVYQLLFTFNAPLTELPKINLSNVPDNENPFLPEQSADRKTLTYWLTDSLVYQQDTIFVAAEYCAHDNDNEYITKNDTIRFVKKKVQEPKKDNKKNNEIPKREVLDIKITPSGSMDVFDTLRITFSEPIADFPVEKIHIRQKVDTLWENRAFPFLRDTLNPRIFWVNQPWTYDHEYQIKIDSAAIFSIYDKWNDSVQVNLKIRSEKEYGNIFVALAGNETAGFGQLLDNSGKVVKQTSLENGELDFFDIKPGKYYLRYIEDLNGNMRWDTGLYAEKLQSEPVYYYNGFFDLKAYMEFENETPWNIQALPLDKQKPLEITKNKPKEKQTKKHDENRNVRTDGSSTPSNRPSIGGQVGGGAISRRQN
jgi:hypothetical protein